MVAAFGLMVSLPSLVVTVNCLVTSLPLRVTLTLETLLSSDVTLVAAGLVVSAAIVKVTPLSLIKVLEAVVMPEALC